MTSTTHRYAGDDRCTCGGLATYFEDPDRDGFTGDGCEAAGLTFTHVREQRRCPFCDDLILDGTPFARMADPKFWDRHPHGCRPDYLVHVPCGESEGYERITR